MLRLVQTVIVAAAAIAASPSGALELVDCRISPGPSSPGISARCATMIRPENPDDPDGATIELKVAVVPALDLDPETDPLVPLAGGPGQSAIDMYAGYRRAFEPIRRNRDILLVEQRGTGESAPLECPVDEDIVEGRLGDEETRRFTEDCLDGLANNPRYFTTSVAVRDLEAVREALGYPSLNLYGVSYGTRVAQHYARRYPEQTRTIILDGVVPPQLPLGPEIATESQRAVDELFARCSENEACNAAFPNLSNTFDVLIEDLDAQPRELRLPDPRTGRPETATVGSSELAAAVRFLVYHPDSMSLLPLMIHEAGKGNLVPIVSAFRMSISGLSSSLAIGMHNSVLCTEDIPYYVESDIDYDAIEDSYMGAMQLSALKAICDVWPTGIMDENFNDPLATDLPVLLLSGEVDPITPPRYALMAMEQMRNARHIAEPDQGHGIIPVGCMPDLAAEFVATRDPEALDRSCMDRAFSMPFFVDFTGPTP